MNIFFGKTSNNMFFIILMYYFYIAITDSSKEFNKKEKILFISIYILTMLFITGIMYITFNPVNSTIIRGVQARYMYPVLPLLMCAISNNELTKKNKNYAKIISIQYGIILMSILQTII